MVGSVLFALCTQAGGHILMEKRPATDSYFPGQWVIPGGKPKAIDQDVTATLFREMDEELGCRPGLTIDLTDHIDQTLYYAHEGDPNFLVKPYAILSWLGHVPSRVLDTGHELRWCSYDEVEASDAGFTRVVGQAIRALALNDWKH